MTLKLKQYNFTEEDAKNLILYMSNREAVASFNQDPLGSFDSYYPENISAKERFSLSKKYAEDSIKAMNIYRDKLSRLSDYVLYSLWVDLGNQEFFFCQVEPGISTDCFDRSDVAKVYKYLINHS